MQGVQVGWANFWVIGRKSLSQKQEKGRQKRDELKDIFQEEATYMLQLELNWKEQTVMYGAIHYTCAMLLVFYKSTS